MQTTELSWLNVNDKATRQEKKKKKTLSKILLAYEIIFNDSIYS